jgi:arsenate reductase-like glutaredoxin family protein
VTIRHNPARAISRKVPGMIGDAAVEPHVIEYLKPPP